MAAQPVLATMPLHASSALYGEQGLRERLTLETAAFSGADQHRIAAALELAARLHQSDRRQREPYVNHYADLVVIDLSAGALVAAA